MPFSIFIAGLHFKAEVRLFDEIFLILIFFLLISSTNIFFLYNCFSTNKTIFLILTNRGPCTSRIIVFFNEIDLNIASLMSFMKTKDLADLKELIFIFLLFTIEYNILSTAEKFPILVP